MSAQNDELQWLLQNDIHTTIDNLLQILNECSVSINNQAPAQHSLLYTSQNQLDTVKINLTLDGFKITNSDINIKLTSRHPVHTIRTCIKDTPWRLYQIQDASNHLSIAIDLLSAQNKFESAEEASHFINQVMNCLLKGRSSLMIPRKSSIEELQHSQNMQSISPALPLDFTISFYIQAHNLICSVYQLSQSNNRPQVKNEYQAETGIPCLSDVLVFFSLGLQTCQQFKDKLLTLTT